MLRRACAACENDEVSEIDRRINKTQIVELEQKFASPAAIRNRVRECESGAYEVFASMNSNDTFVDGKFKFQSEIRTTSETASFECATNGQPTSRKDKQEE